MTNEELRKNTTIAEKDPDMERFSFEDPTEMVLYVKHCKAVGKNNGVAWTSSREYMDRFKKGYDLFEDGQFEKALEAYRDALTVNPVGVRARFEICECYLNLGMLPEAKQTLMDLQEYLVKPTDIACFYRRVSYIATEQEDYRLAVACLLYSREFERSPYVTRELMYIMSVAKDLERVSDPEQVLEDAGIPVLETDIKTKNNG